MYTLNDMKRFQFDPGNSGVLNGLAACMSFSKIAGTIPDPKKRCADLMPEHMLFTDASLDPRSRIGFGAYLIVKDAASPLMSIKANILIKRFENTSSTTLELQVLLWALRDPRLLGRDGGLKVYTDSQNIINLPARRERLEKNNYYSNANKQIKNGVLYRQFFNLLDGLDFRLIKVVGHQPTQTKNDIDALFTLVDRASRTALRNFNNTNVCVQRQ